ncbi:conserved hypothetical protein [Ricinus communis]|uniref:Uncharacterized protein n=1 Tax=Ricinus communis TaxID=3988 RepID=B9RSH1_RICCO|nr:conserved hypothetical protein [Ricinus communis]
MSMGNDQVVWNHFASGIHSSKSAYERVRSTLWLTTHERLATASLCARKSILPSSLVVMSMRKILYMP